MTQFTLDTGIIHFVGIGGIGMSGIAEVLFDLGYKVSGSDIQHNSNVERLQSKGIKVHIGQRKENIYKVSVIVVSSAIKDSNRELIAARAARLPIVRRADMLAELMRFRKSIAVGGTHGKTTTTSMLSSILVYSKLDPTIVNGGIIDSYGTNARLGKGEWMVVEADESDGTFTRLPATIVALTNIDEEHLDFYGNFDNLKLAFKNFVENIPFYGFAVICNDYEETNQLIESIRDRRVISYGLNEKANYSAKNLLIIKGKTFFDVVVNKRSANGNHIIKNISVSLPGEYNVRNALGAIAVSYELGIDANNIKEGLKSFTGVERRFSLLDKINGISIIDDYAHHPTEIKSILQAARSICTGKIVTIFQPHRFSRVKTLFDKFVKSFSKADTVFITDIYSAGEQAIRGVNKKKIISSIIKAGHKDARLLDDFDNLADELSVLCKSGDFIIFLGAGSISRIAKKVAKQLKNKLN
tara:strand:- start:493 stop:1902 length:1410 start_codon:yes stop_codon:yes gene_type:complete